MTSLTKENLIQILQDDPVLLEEMRSLLLTKELLDLPQRFAEFAEYVNKQFEIINKQFEAINRQFEIINKQFDEVNIRLEILEKDTTQLKADVTQLKIDVGQLKGKSLEYEMPGRVRSRIEHRFNIRRTRVVRASTQYIQAHDFDDAVYGASDTGAITENQRQRILDTDMIVQGRTNDTGRDVYIAVESSFTISDSDITRARRTAAALRKVFPDADVSSAVYCAVISDGNTQMAEEDRVQVITNVRL